MILNVIGTPLLSPSGSWTFGGTGNTNNESLTWDFETVANEVGISSATGVTTLAWGGAGAIFKVGTTTVTNAASVVTLSDSSSGFTKLKAYRLGDTGASVGIGNLGLGGNALARLTLSAGAGLGWSTVHAESGDVDVLLFRDAAAILALRDGTNAQTFRAYNTYTDASNGEWGFLQWTANVLELGTAANGSGTRRALSLLSGSGSLTMGGTGNTNNESLTFDFETTANNVLMSSATGAVIVRWAMHHYPTVHATYDLGAGGLTWRDAFLRRVNIQDDANGYVSFGAAGADVFIRRDAANTLALRNGTNAQAFNIYNTYTDASNYERLGISWAGNVASLRVTAAGTGEARQLRLLGSTYGAIGLTVDLGANVSSPLLQLVPSSGANAWSNGYVAIGSTAGSTATSGTHIGLNVREGAQPTATATLAFRALQITPTINFSAGTPGAGSYEAIRIAVTETALPTGQSYMIRALGGAAAATDVFSVTNAGVVKSAGYQSSDGSAGVSAGPYTTITSITVKDGLITAISGS